MQNSNADKKPEAKENKITRLALQKIAALADGNGVGVNDVTLVAAEEDWFEFPAELHVRLKPDIAERRVNGKAGDGRHMASNREELNRMIDNAGHDVLSNKDTVRTLLEKIDRSPGGGWGQDDVKYPLGDLKREFYLTEQCGSCKGAARMNCRACSGQGALACPQCFSQGRIRCVPCGGDGRIQQGNNPQAPCNFCAATGFVVCNRCAGKKTIVCTTCNGARQEGCTACGQTGWQTQITEAHFQALTQFFPDVSKLLPELKESLEKIGISRLAVENHANTQRQKGQEFERENVLILPYRAELPFAIAQFRLKGKNLKAHVCGLRALITKMPPFLDKMLEDGFSALRRAARGDGNPRGLITLSCQYRAIRDILLHCSGRIEKQVARELFEKYKPALSPKFALALTHNAKAALRQTTRLSRYVGLCVGVLLAAGGYHLWFWEGLRADVMKSVSSPQVAILTDFGVYLAGFLLNFYIIRLWAKRALNNALAPARAKAPALPAAGKKEKQGLPDAGTAGIWAIVVTLAVFLILAGLSDPPPFWIRNFLARF